MSLFAIIGRRPYAGEVSKAVCRIPYMQILCQAKWHPEKRPKSEGRAREVDPRPLRVVVGGLCHVSPFRWHSALVPAHHLPRYSVYNISSNHVNSSFQTIWLSGNPATALKQAKIHLAVLSPLVLAPDGGLLLGRKVVDDVEGPAQLFRRLAPDHLSDNLAP